MKKVIIIFLILIVLAAGGIAGEYFYMDSLIYKTNTAEVGTEIELSDILKKEGLNAAFTAESDQIDNLIPDTYNLIFTMGLGLFDHTATVTIVDTVAPVVEVQDLTVYTGATPEASEFVVSVDDVTAVTIAYEEEPDFTTMGTRKVTISVTDAGGNKRNYTPELTITPVYEELTIEAGESVPKVTEFAIDDMDCQYVTEVKEIDTCTVADYDVEILVDGLTFTSVLHVVDTVAPKAAVKNIECLQCFNLDLEDFIVHMTDATEVTVTTESTYDSTTVGEYPITIILTDEGGNVTEKDVTLTILEDTEAPVIKGNKDFTMYPSMGVTYLKFVSVTDNSGDQLDFEVDSSQVDLETQGTYPVVYTATDAAGNSTSVTVRVTIKLADEHTEEEVLELANQVINKILRAGLSDWGKLETIYNWVRANVTYTGTSEKGNWILAAYEGLTKGVGDCYTYASVSQALLTAAGFENFMITKIPTETFHYWNAVKYEGSWYHFDTTPRSNGEVIFMYTEEELIDWNNRSGGKSEYDRSKYPEFFETDED